MKLITGFLICFVSGFLSLSFQVPDTTKYTIAEPYDFHLKYLKTDPALLIDVREPFEFKRRRIQDAVNIPSSGNIGRSADTLDKEITYFLYCSTDYRSKRVADKLSDRGFEWLVVLKGGITAWKNDKMQIDRKRLKKKKIHLPQSSQRFTQSSQS
jgi:rhodanese-related sulfurtransferase